MPKFTHLHVHSHYSLLDGLPKIDELLEHTQKTGMNSLALTDHGALYGAVEFYKKAKEKGIKPIIGVETYLAKGSMKEKQAKVDDKRYHLILLVKNKQGYENLVKLVTASYLEGFYYKPRIDEEFLFKHAEGLICLSGCLQGKIPQLILSGKTKEAEKTAVIYRDVFGRENFYLELQKHPNIKGQEKINEEILKISRATGIPVVATADSHYLKKEDAEAQDILMLINTGARPDDPERLTLKGDDFSLKSPEEMIKDFKEIPQAIENTQKVAELCNFDFELGKIKFPHFEVPEGKTPDEYLKELCLKGFKEKFQKEDSEATKRLNYELEVIKKTGFATYFLIVQDFVNWAKRNQIVVGPGRGSAAGSLVAYCLGITNVDPLKYDLLFERFMNPERISPPDIDVDFTDRRRDEVIQYVAQKYGQNRVAQIGTFGTMAARAVVRDVGRALNLPYSFCDQLAKMIPMNLSLEEALSKVKELKDFVENSEDAQRLIEIAKKLEGVARHVSTHACGVVISKDPLEKIVPLQHPSQDEKTIITQYEMHSIEDLGLLKMDFLGLKNLTIIEDTLRKIAAIHGKEINIENLPLDDPKTYQLLQNGDTIGVFQLESEGMRRYLRELKPTELEDIIALIALYRPGPLQFIPEYIARKHKKKEVTYLHPKLKPILEKTYGICIYQEQLMQIAQKLAGFSLAEADVLRKAVGKKIKELLLEQEEKMIKGMVNNGIPEKIAKEIWNWVLPFARYGFNRSHSVCYALVAYQTAWLKAHYPVEFMSSLLTAEQNDVERIGFIIREAKKMGIEVLPPDINESFLGFSVIPKTKKIRFGLLAIKNVGHNVVEAILKERKANGHFTSISDFLTRIPIQDLNKKSLESLIKAGAFDKLEERNKLLTNLEKLLEWARDFQKNKSEGQMGLFDGMRINSKLNLKEVKPASPHQRLTWEKELLGLYISGHPAEEIKEILKKRALSISEINQDKNIPLGARVIVGGVIVSLKKIITKKGDPMLFMKLEDLTGNIEVIVFPSTIEKNPLAFQENKLVFVTGRLDRKDDIPKILCDEIEEIIQK